MQEEMKAKTQRFLQEFVSLIDGAQIDERGASLSVTRDDITAPRILRIRNAMTGSEWRRKPSGKLLFQVQDGHWGTIKTYRERKDGSYNPALIEEVSAAAASYIANRKWKQERRDATEQARDALRALGVFGSYYLNPTAQSDKPAVDVKFTIGLDKLDAVIKSLLDLGVLELDN
jgi:hypothetical protein